jgi:hypothetical protein
MTRRRQPLPSAQRQMTPCLGPSQRVQVQLSLRGPPKATTGYSLPPNGDSEVGARLLLKPTEGHLGTELVLQDHYGVHLPLLYGEWAL